MSTEPDANEVAIRDRLVQLVDGPPTAPPMPTGRPRDWLDQIIDTDLAPPPELPPPQPPAPRKKPVPHRPAKPAAPPKPRRTRRPPKPRPGTPRAGADSRPTPPRQSLTDAWNTIPPRLKSLAYHATAAAAGHPLGWIGWGTDTAAWYAAGNWTTPSAWVLYGFGLCVCALYRRTRGWWWPVAWAAAIPVSSITAGVLLYGTGYHP